MKGQENYLYRFFEGSEKRFIIPLYQRNYDWDDKNCEQLFNDLVMLHKQKRKSHFFGSIVSSHADSCSEDRLIIDGQQRITTVSLILIAIYNAAKVGDMAYSDKTKTDFIWETYLVDKYQENTRKVKLKPIKKDMEAFDALLFKPQAEYIKDSNVTRNYMYFYDKVTTCGLTLDELLASIKKLLVIDIRLEQDDDPQLIFESLNSTGLDLSEADKIRNYLLMSFDNEKQTFYYNQYWNKIEECTDYKPTMFVRDYLTVKLRRICKTENLYFEFKNFVAQRSSREESMKEMLVFAKYYRQVNVADFPNNSLRKKVTQLNTLGSSVAMPFYIQFLKYAEDKKLNDEEIYSVFDTIENYWARRIICNLPTNAINKVFSTLHYEVTKAIEKHIERGGSPVSYFEVLKYVLLKKQGTAVFPQDKIVEEQFKVRKIYKIPTDYRYFLFERMENENGKETHNVVEEMKAGHTTIEHIMPQTLTADWKRALGEDYERIYDQYLHTFANLTLTGYNTNYSNHSFKEKKYGYIDNKGNHVYGFCDSAYRLNNFLKECDEWNERTMVERQNLLLKKFFGLWPMIETKYVPLTRETDVVSMEDEADLTGRNILAFTYRGSRYEVTTWKDMLLSICKQIFTDNQDAMKSLCSKEDWFHCKESKGCTSFADGCYVYTSCSTSTKMTILNILFKHCNIPTSDLEFELASVQDVNEIVDET